MKAEFYRSQTELLPTFSLVLSVSLVGLNTTTCVSAKNANKGDLGTVLPAVAHYAHTYYEQAEQTVDQSEQVETLRRFAENLLKETEDSPQAVVDALNQHFWELV